VLTSREKLMAGLFAVQVVAAVAFGGVLVHGLRHDRLGTTTLSPAGLPGASGAPNAHNSAGPILGGGANPGAGGRPGSGSTHTAGGNVGATDGGSRTTGGAPSGKSEIAAGAPIRIGSIVTQSGAINFKSSAQGTKAYLDMVNANGGIDGHKIELIQYDDQLSASTGQSEFKSLATQGIFTYAAFNAPATEGGLKQLLDGTGIPLLGSYGMYDEFHDNLAFSFTAASVHYGYEMGAYLKKLGVKKPALIYVTNADSRVNAQVDSGFTQGFGAAPTYKAVKQPTDSYQNDVTQMRINGVDGLASVLDVGSYQRFLQAAGSYAQQLKHVADPLFDVPAIKSLSNSDGTYVASDLEFVDSSNPKVQAYSKAVTTAFGSAAQIDYIGLVGWMDAALLVDALKSMHGVYTKAGLVKAVEGLGTYDTGISSPLLFATGKRDINRCLQFGKLSGGKVVPTQGYTCDTQAT
jgi:branched-chain amino acid transport system substrate-binding protein